MIDEAIGKILGMAMAYGVSGLGLLLAYVNYRKRVVKAQRVMSGTAWGVLAAIVLAVAGGVFVVSRLASGAPAGEPVAAPAVEEAAETAAVGARESSLVATPATAEGTGDRWPWVGIVVPAGIFLFATFLTAALHRHFSRPAAP